MKILRMISITAFLILGQKAVAEVREIHYMKELMAAVQPGDLVVFDLDNTVMRPAQTLGSDQWFRDQVAKYKSHGLSQDEAVDSAVQDFANVQSETSMEPVEQEVAQDIKNLQEEGIATIALTARPLELTQTTLGQLRNLNVRFDQMGYRLRADGIQAPAPIIIDRGVVLVGPKNNKGLILRDMILRLKEKPKRIVFIDDRANNTDNMEAALKPTQIANLNLRYGFLDSWANSYNAQIAEVEWAVFRLRHMLMLDSDVRSENVTDTPDEYAKNNNLESCGLKAKVLVANLICPDGRSYEFLKLERFGWYEFRVTEPDYSNSAIIN